MTQITQQIEKVILSLANFPQATVCRHHVMAMLVGVLESSGWVPPRGTLEQFATAVCENSAGDAYVISVLENQIEIPVEPEPEPEPEMWVGPGMRIRIRELARKRTGIRTGTGTGTETATEADDKDGGGGGGEGDNGDLTDTKILEMAGYKKVTYNSLSDTGPAYFTEFESNYGPSIRSRIGKNGTTVWDTSDTIGEYGSLESVLKLVSSLIDKRLSNLLLLTEELSKESDRVKKATDMINGNDDGQLWWKLGYKRPPPEDLVDALQDRIHPASGRLISSTPVSTKSKTGDQ